MELNGLKINLNTATAEELEALPGIGPALAAGIVQLRQQVGRFSSVEDLLPVRGIGLSQVGKIRDLVTTGWGAGDWEMRVGRDNDTSDVTSLVKSDEPLFLEENSQPAVAEAVVDELAQEEPLEEAEVVGWRSEDAIAENIETGAVESVSEVIEQGAEESGMPAEAESESAEIEVAAPEPERKIHDVPLPAPAAVVEPEAKVESVSEKPAGPSRTATSAPPASKSEEFRLQPPLEIVERKGGMMFWQWLVGVLLGTILGAALTLGILWALNGTLDFGQHWTIRNLQVQMVQMRAEGDSFDRRIDDAMANIETLRQDLTVLPQIRSDIRAMNENLAGTTKSLKEVGERLAGAQSELRAVAKELEALSSAHGSLEARVGEVSDVLQSTVGEVERLSGAMETVTEQAERFDAFLAGLVKLLATTAPAQ